MKSKLFLYMAALPLGLTTVYAQSPQAAIDKFKSNATTWELTNAALLKGIPLPNVGDASLGYFQDNGTFKHTLDAATRRGAQFNASRAHSVNKWDFYGSFDVKIFKDKEVALTDMANPFRDNPYQVADSLSGDWNKQRYALSLRAAAPTLMNGKLVLGLGVDYTVLTGARQKDPRPLDNSNQLSLLPGLVYHLGKNSFLGLNGAWQRYREDLSVELYNYRLSYNTYKLLGLGEYEFSAPIQLSSSTITRAFNGNEFGGNLQYGMKGTAWNLLASAGYCYNKENVIDGTSSPKKAGEHAFHEYAASLALNWSAKTAMHQLAASWKQRNISNKEFHQVQNSTTKQYETVYAAVFNTNLRTRASLSYLLNKSKAGDTLSWSLKAGAGYAGLDNRYATTRAWQTVDKADASLAFTKYFNCKSAAAFSLGILTMYEWVINKRLDYLPKNYSSNFVANNIWIPAHQFMTTPAWNNQLSIQYTFPPFTKSRNQLYVKGTGYLNAAMEDNGWVKKGDTRQGFQLSLGIYN
ncbi:DUF6850 family outer membrane beta-barrel protein [Filimonas effusa]|uniref:DUF6850 domain-containing protein n=1 Tax=Filimonas effusa TaxID=2508721 RepID=A0A4Q1D5C1_9BACT|nr:DUF6850 family outer membrane beta-barrel protein [Filimonas effusa]RXK83690.1 hypothetical protein ESB13_16550 [Filimonas effusa]